jgi:hypothetical protein
VIGAILLGVRTGGMICYSSAPQRRQTSAVRDRHVHVQELQLRLFVDLGTLATMRKATTIPCATSLNCRRKYVTKVVHQGMC